MKKRKRVEKRYHWLIRLIGSNGYTSGAEIGCANGATTYRLLRYCLDLKLYVVDKWEKIEAGAEGGAMEGGPGCENWDPKRGWFRFQQVTRDYGQRLTVLKGDSVEMAQHVPDESLDFVFIDADHRYQAVKADIAAWTPKVKAGGFITGHDIHLSGVLRAVEEAFPGYTDTGIDHVWFIKKQADVD